MAPERDSALLLDRRVLLDYLLKDVSRQGGRVVCPPGASGSEPWLLDSLDVRQLIKAMQAGVPLDLGRLSAPTPGRPAAAAPNGGSHTTFSGSATMPSRLPPAAPNHSRPTSNVDSIPVYSMSSLTNGAGRPNSGGGGSLKSYPTVPGASGSASSAVAPNPFGGPDPDASAAPNPFASSPFEAAPNPFGDAGVASGSSGPMAAAKAAMPWMTKKAAPGPSRPSGDGQSLSGRLSGGGAAPVYATSATPFFDMPQLQTGLEEYELREVAFLLFCANVDCNAGGVAANGGALLLDMLRAQLEVDEGRARDMQQLLRHLGGSVSPQQRASLETLVRLLEAGRPHDFGPQRFRAFLRWRDVAAHVLQLQLARNAADSWAGTNAGGAKRLMASLKGALRRLDVRSTDDFDEDEYGEAAAGVSHAARKLATSCAGGWRFPWALRVRLCEVLLHGAFDAKDLSQYAEHHEAWMAALEQQLFPMLGVSPAAHLACFAWAHFTSFQSSGQASMLHPLKRLITQLAAECTTQAPPAWDGPEATSSETAAAKDRELDRALAAEVSGRLVTYSQRRLADYHTQFPGGENMQGMVDVLVFACRSRGEGEEAIQVKLSGIVRDAVGAAFAHRAASVPAHTAEGRLLGLVDVVVALRDEEMRCYCRVMGQHLGPSALPLAAARLHGLYAAELMPWLSKGPMLDEPGLRVFQAAGQLEAELAELVMAPPPLPGVALPPPSKAVPLPAGFRRWDMAGPLKAALEQWVVTQSGNLETWTSRQLATEKWRPAGQSVSCASSALEVARMVDETLDALFDMDLLLPVEPVLKLLGGVNSAILRYCRSVIDRLANLRVIPPLPPPTRFKKAEVMAQEAGEASLNRAPSKAGKLAFLTSAPKPAVFMASVPTVETSADFPILSTELTTPVITTCTVSLHYLAGRMDGVADSVRRRWSAKANAGASSQKVPDALSGALASCRAALAAGVLTCCSFLADKVTFWDLRQEWLEQVYRHHVSARRLDPILDQLHNTLVTVCGTLGDDVKDAFALRLLRASAQALARVYLDGGPCRWYCTPDVPLLEQDLIRLKNIFFADGEGLPRDAIDAEMELPLRLLKAMALETGPLMELLKTARARGSAQLTIAGQPVPYEEAELMRVLAHRPDRVGSKVLKEKYKMSKKLKP